MQELASGIILVAACVLKTVLSDLQTFALALRQEIHIHSILVVQSKYIGCLVKIVRKFSRKDIRLQLFYSGMRGIIGQPNRSCEFMNNIIISGY